MPYLTLGKFYLDLRALCSFVLVNGRLGLRQTLAPFALFRLSDYFEFTPYNPFGKPILVLDDESLLAFEAAAMRSALCTRFDELGGLFLLHNLYTPSFLLKSAKQHDLARLCLPLGAAILAHTFAAYFLNSRAQLSRNTLSQAQRKASGNPDAAFVRRRRKAKRAKVALSK